MFVAKVISSHQLGGPSRGYHSNNCACPLLHFSVKRVLQGRKRDGKRKEGKAIDCQSAFIQPTIIQGNRINNLVHIQYNDMAAVRP